ncbi:MAG: DctP protein, partial [Acidobacteriota bacterium]|nr:DctP protein [Acidobacteriota bacterium]
MRRSIASAVVLALGVSCSPGGGSGPTVIRLGHIGFPDSPFDHGARHFKELVEARFPGQVEIRIFGTGQLGE